MVLFALRFLPARVSSHGNVMKMWSILPATMCDQHILGEHVDMHVFADWMRHRREEPWHYIKNGMVNVNAVTSRHDVLAEEMVKRSRTHNSPAITFTIWRFHRTHDELDLIANIAALHALCAACKEMWGMYYA